MAIRVLLADDHAHVRTTLHDILRKEPQIEVVGEAADGRVAADLASTLRPDIVLMDLTMPVLSGIQATRLITAEIGDVAQTDGGGGTKVIAVSLHTDSRMVAEALAAGASGYVLKNNVARDLIPAIRAALAGQTYLSDRLTPAVAQSAPDESGLAALSHGERDIVRLAAEGRTDSDISLSLHLSTAALDQCRRGIMKKLRLRSPAEWATFILTCKVGRDPAGEGSRTPAGFRQ